jgi:hypothetical protein
MDGVIGPELYENDVRQDPRGSLALRALGGATRIGPGKKGLKRPPFKSLPHVSPQAG